MRGANLCPPLLVAFLLLSSSTALAFADSGGVICSNYCGGGSSTGGSQCASTASISGPGYCYVVETFNTPITAINQQSLFGSPATSGPYPMSQANAINQYNSQSTQWLLTCPLNPAQTPNPVDQRLFYSSPFNNNQYQNVAGDVCQANTQQPLPTTVTLPVNVFWSATQTAFATANLMTAPTAASLQVSDLAYSPMLQVGGRNVIPNGFATNTYIFNKIPSYAQHGIWSWSAAFADFSRLQQDQQTVTATPTYVYSDPNTADQTCTKDSQGNNVCTPDNNAAYTCTYNYQYTETTTLQSATNVQIPFNEVITSQSGQQDNKGKGQGSQQQVTYSQFNAQVIPYLLFNFSLPSTDAQLMNQSYDIFSPWNYYTPSNSIEMFPIDTPSRFYVSYKNSLISGDANGIKDLNSVQQLLGNVDKFLQGGQGNVQGLENALLKHGYRNPTLANPISVAAMPNDYVFVLNESCPNNALGFCSNGNYWLTVLRLVPQGYYNTSIYPPNSVSSVSDTQNKQSASLQQFTANWKSYWANVIDLQNQTTYVVDSYDLGNVLTNYNSQASSVCSSQSGGIACGPFVPLNISVDDYGDVFITGSLGTTGTQQAYPAIVAITNALSPNYISVTNTPVEWSVSTSTPVLQDIAATPTGGFVFGATQSSGTLYRFSGRNLTQLPQLSLAFNKTSGGVTNAALNITNYLYNGGLYNLSFPNVVGNGATFNPATDFDKNSYHHPLGLQELNGYLYVLDDWSADPGLGSWVCGAGGISLFGLGVCSKINMNILLLRVLNSSGYNVPLGPTLFNDMWQQQSCSADKPNLLNTCTSAQPQVTCLPSNACQLQVSGFCGQGQAVSGTKYACVNSGSKSSTYYSVATGAYTAGNTYPPYGWVLSANITIGGQGGSTTTFCSSPKCTYGPSGTMPQKYRGNYEPIGPGLASSYSQFGNVGFTVNFNSTINLIMKTLSSTHWGWCSFLSIPYPCLITANYPQYNELVTGVTLNLENYTRLFDGFSGTAPYCFTDSQNDNSISGCSLLSNVQYMTSPVYTVANPFRYLEGLGAVQVLTLAGHFASSYPPGTKTAQGGYTNAGPPSLAIQYAPVGWGTLDQISAQTPSSGNTINIVIDGTTAASGTGMAEYSVCASVSSCLSPGSHVVQAVDVGGGKVSTTLVVNPTPLITLTPQVQVQGQAETITVTAFDPTHNVELFIDGNLKGGPAPGIAYTESDQPVGNHVVVATDTSNQQSSNAMLKVVSGTLATTAPPLAVTESLSSKLAGYLIVPYQYTYQITQSYQLTPPSPGSSNPMLSGGDGDEQCPSLPAAPQPQTFTVYSYALANGVSNLLSATLEGGNTYLDLGNNNFFRPNVSDANLVLPPQLQYTIKNDRIFGSIYVNATACTPATILGTQGLDCSRNNQVVLNATNQTQYQINLYQQTAPNNPAQLNGGYETFGQWPVNPTPLYSTTLAGSKTQQAVFTVNSAALNVITVAVPSVVPLFEINKQTAYTGQLGLFMNGTTPSCDTCYYAYGQNPALLGYQRIVYVYTDRFGNGIYAPMDVDIARPVSITLSVQPSVDQNNANMTHLTVTGRASIPTIFGTAGPLANQQIYLYYNKDLNYVTYNPVTDPTNAVYCGFSVANTPYPVTCVRSDPISADNQQYAGQYTYAPSFNAVGTTCSPPPNSLLGSTIQKCNLYNAYGLNALCPGTGPKGSIEQFCSPIYYNGTGMCTSQLGLFDIATTDANGYFSNTITACGSRQDTIIAQYYGSPGPEPVEVTQAPLALSEQAVSTPSSGFTPTNEFNYHYAPSQPAQTTFRIGLFELGYGNVDAFGLVLTISLVALFLIWKGNRR